MVRWLCGNHADRARFADMARHLGDVHAFGVSIGTACLVTAYWYGWSLVLLVAVAAATMVIGGSVSRRHVIPELACAVAFMLLELNLALSVMLSGGAHSPLLSLMLVPVFSQAVAFRPQVTAVGVTLSAVLAVLAAIAGASRKVVDLPPTVPLLAYLVLLFCLSLVAYYLASSDLNSRGDAVIDPLTGLFNRKALSSRFADARAQAVALDTSVAVILCDLDHFKKVNDTHGHDRGDCVLRELAQRFRHSLRTFELVYRLGGEEFLVLLPGTDETGAAAVAERLRADVAAEPLAGLAVTISVGVASGRGNDLELTRLTKFADLALYGAKRAGRNRVEVAAVTPVAPVAQPA